MLREIQLAYDEFKQVLCDTKFSKADFKEALEEVASDLQADLDAVTQELESEEEE